MLASGVWTTYTHNPASELLGTDLGGALTTFGYDAAGNTVREVGPGVEVTYTCNAENRSPRLVLSTRRSIRIMSSVPGYCQASASLIPATSSRSARRSCSMLVYSAWS